MLLSLLPASPAHRLENVLFLWYLSTCYQLDLKRSLKGLQEAQEG